MNQNDVFIQRLAHIKYLWLQSEEQSLQAEPFCGFSLLTMQDAIEMFLLTGIAKHECKSHKNDNFENMWESLNEKISLTQKPVIQQLNKARVSLKHHLIFPSRIQINEYVIHARTFLKENTPKVFYVDFEQISLADLILSDEIRILIKKSEEYLANNQFDDSLAKCGIAFIKLISNFNSQVKIGNLSQNSISDFYYTLDSVKIKPDCSSTGGGTSREMKCTKSLAKQTEKFLDAEKENARKIDSFLILNTIGIPYGKFIRFKSTTPEITPLFNGDYRVQKHIHEITNPSSVQFCISFVVECALKVQGFVFY